MTIHEWMKAAYPPAPFKPFTAAEWREYFKTRTWIPAAVVEKMLAGVK